MIRFGLALILALSVAAPATAARLSREAEWLAGYLRIDTTNPPGREDEAAEYLAGIARDGGLLTELYVSPAGRTSLVVRLPATDPGAPWIALVHHLDVVPADVEGWSRPPFAGEIADGDLIGRGAVDDKSLGVAHLAALIDASRLPERRRGLVLFAVADEEAGGGQGMAWLVERHPELFDGIEAALGEGGLNRTVVGRTHFWGLEVAQKRAYWLQAVATGRPGHGSSLNPESAAHRLIRGLARLVDRPRRWRLDPPALGFVRAMVADDPAMRGRGFHADEALGPDGPAPWLPPGLWGLALDTIQVTRLDAGERTNVVSAEARARLDVRLLPETDAEAFLAGMRSDLGRGIDLEVHLATPPAPASSTDTEVWRLLAATLGAEAPVLPAMIPGITDSRFLRRRGIDAYGFSPFELESDALLRVHAHDERIPLAVFDAGVERMKRVVGALLSPAAD
jgi:acetylornithine deacetylase/succinyl-diaminopimelate desuccinylase-like protein